MKVNVRIEAESEAIADAAVEQMEIEVDTKRPRSNGVVHVYGTVEVENLQAAHSVPTV